MAEEDVCIGVDLGTTFSCVGVWKGGRVEIIANDIGSRTTPSYVAFTEAERLVGAGAKSQAAMNPENTVFDAKRLIGRDFADPEVQQDMKQWPFRLFEKDGHPTVEVEWRAKKHQFTPEEISSMVLGKMKQTAEDYLGHPVTKAVITVPAYFNDHQRQATKDAGALAGLQVMRIINEPTAAASGCSGFGRSSLRRKCAVAYGLAKKKRKGRSHVLIFDLGGGTFDVSLLQMEGGVFTVKATCGNTHLGGEDFDHALVTSFLDAIKKKHGVDLSQSARGVRRLRTACEQAKRALSTASSVSVEVDALIDGEDFVTKLTRSRFEHLCAELFSKLLDPVKKVLLDGKLDKKAVDEVVLVGGSTRIPKVQELLREFFGGKELCKSINPDEAVAHGAAVQGAILTGASDVGKDLLLLDVTPLSLGVETVGGNMSVIIKRNTTIPCSRTDSFTTVEDNQRTIDFQIYEGERPLTKFNNLLGEFQLTGIPPAKRGVAKITVEMSIDSNGILSVKARDEGTGRSSGVSITNNRGRLSHDDIGRMLENAKTFDKLDRAIRDAQKARSELDSYIGDVKDAMVSLSMTDTEPVESKIQEVQLWMEKHRGARAEKIEEHRREIEVLYNPLVDAHYGRRKVVEDKVADVEEQGGKKKKKKRRGKRR